MTCQKCRIAMQQENHGHLSHGKRKWRCPLCKRARMQKPKEPKHKAGNSQD